MCRNPDLCLVLFGWFCSRGRKAHCTEVQDGTVMPFYSPANNIQQGRYMLPHCCFVFYRCAVDQWHHITTITDYVLDTSIHTVYEYTHRYIYIYMCSMFGGCVCFCRGYQAGESRVFELYTQTDHASIIMSIYFLRSSEEIPRGHMH